MILQDGKNREFTDEEIKQYREMHRFCIPQTAISIETDEHGQKKIAVPQNWGIPTSYELMINPNDLDGVNKAKVKRKVKIIYYTSIREHESNKLLSQYEPAVFIIPKPGFIDSTDYELNWFMMNHSHLQGGINQDSKKTPLFWLYNKKEVAKKGLEQGKIMANIILKLADMDETEVRSIAHAISISEQTHNFQNRLYSIDTMETDEIRQELTRLAQSNALKFAEFMRSDTVDVQDARLKLLEAGILEENIHSKTCFVKNLAGQKVILFKYQGEESEQQGFERWSKDKKQKYGELVLRLEEIPA